MMFSRRSNRMLQRTLARACVSLQTPYKSTQWFTTTLKASRHLLDDSKEIDTELIDTDNLHPSRTSSNIADEAHSNDSFHSNMHMHTHNSADTTPPPSSEQMLTRQKKTWQGISQSLQGIWDSMESIDKTNVKRIDRVYQKLLKLEELHVKNIQHSLHHIAMLREEVATVHQRMSQISDRLNDLEQETGSEWLEWKIPKCEIPFGTNGVYLRSPGYELGSMIWCMEVRWEIDPQYATDSDEVNDTEYDTQSNPIIDMRSKPAMNDDSTTEDGTGSGVSGDDDASAEQQRRTQGYRRLGIYVSPRSVANWQRLSSLKATCEVKVNDETTMPKTHSDSAMSFATAVHKKQQHFSVSGEFLRERKLMSWGRTLSNGDEFFDAHSSADDDEIGIKLRIINQTLSYQQFVDHARDADSTSMASEHISAEHMETKTATPTTTTTSDSDFDSSALIDKQKQRQKQRHETDAELDDKVREYTNMPMDEFWRIFSEHVESGKSKRGMSIAGIAKLCQLDLNLVSMFRRGPMALTDEDILEQQQQTQTLNTSQRERRRKQLLKRKVNQAEQWQKIVEYDMRHPEFRNTLASFLVKYLHKKVKNSQSKAGF